MRKITDKVQIAKRKQYRRDYANRYYKAHREKYLEYQHVYYQTYKKKAQERNAITRPKRLLRIKTEVLTYYGNGSLACTRCRYDNIDALTIDHVNGGGTQHRKKHNLSGNSIYYWLKSNDFPEGYQTLCMNCQLIKAIESGERPSLLKELGYAP